MCRLGGPDLPSQRTETNKFCDSRLWRIQSCTDIHWAGWTQPAQSAFSGGTGTGSCLTACMRKKYTVPSHKYSQPCLQNLLPQPPTRQPARHPLMLAMNHLRFSGHKCAPYCRQEPECRKAAVSVCPLATCPPTEIPRSSGNHLIGSQATDQHSQQG